MARKHTVVLVLKDEDVKIRKRQAPPGKVVQSKKIYNRKREKRRDPETGHRRFFIGQRPY